MELGLIVVAVSARKLAASKGRYQSNGSHIPGLALPDSPSKDRYGKAMK
jgi:hypothetical protein